MRILAKESVIRYHVEFDEEETLLLKGIGFLPPYAEPCARLWSTSAEIDETHTMLAHAREELEERSEDFDALARAAAKAKDQK
jgi:hypothetical protein